MEITPSKCCFRIHKDPEGYSESKNWEQLLARPLLVDPTHGVIVDKEFYVIVSSRWDRVSDDESSFKSGSPAEVWKVPVT